MQQITKQSVMQLRAAEPWTIPGLNQERISSPFHKVILTYGKVQTRQARRRTRQGRDFFTKDEQAAMAFYSTALQLIMWIPND